jgi:hypothetical protein
MFLDYYSYKMRGTKTRGQINQLPIDIATTYVEKNEDRNDLEKHFINESIG